MVPHGCFTLPTLFLLTFILCCRETSTTSRWLNPCSLNPQAGGASGSVSALERRLAARNSQDVQNIRNIIELGNSFLVLSERFSSLKRRVRDLKGLYVSERFRDASIVEDFERVGLRIEGMPAVRDSTAATVTDLNVIEIMHSAYENLARIAVFLDQARLGETLARNERTSFSHHYQRLENDNEHGLYWLLCALYQVIVLLPDAQLDPEVIRGVQGIRVAEVDSTSVRHTRDFIVLRDMERVLDQLVVDFAAIHMLVRGSSRR